jgi:hypothetical protein
LVLVFEDLHWADDALLDFIDHVEDWAGDVPTLVVCTARPELLDRRGGWGGGKRNALTVALSPLADSDIARLISSLLERGAASRRDPGHAAEHGGGQPALRAEEYVRMLIDRGHLQHDGGRWRLVPAAPGSPLSPLRPGSPWVSAVVVARPPDTNRKCQATRGSRTEAPDGLIVSPDLEQDLQVLGLVARGAGGGTQPRPVRLRGGGRLNSPALIADGNHARPASYPR